jgi:hypothetical protein
VSATCPQLDVDKDIADASIDLATKIKGLLPNANLDQITDPTKLADAIISAAKLATGAVGSDKLADSAVISSKIAEDAVDLTKHVSGLLPGANLAQITDAAKLADLIVTNAKLAGGIDAKTKLAALSIVAELIASDAIVSRHILAGSIITDKLAAEAVTAAKIKGGTITGDKIAGATITGDLIAGLSIAAGHLAAGAVIADKIGANAVTAGKINANAVTSREILAGSVTTDKLDAGAVTAAKIGAGEVRAEHINVDDLTVNKLRLNECAVINPHTDRDMGYHLLTGKDLTIQTGTWETIDSFTIHPFQQGTMVVVRGGVWETQQYWDQFAQKIAILYTMGDMYATYNTNQPAPAPPTASIGVSYQLRIRIKEHYSGAYFALVDPTGNRDWATTKYPANGLPIVANSPYYIETDVLVSSLPPSTIQLHINDGHYQLYTNETYTVIPTA